MTVTVTDDEDPVPTVFWLGSSYVEVGEGGTRGSNAYIDEAITAGLAVSYRISGTATCGTDYTLPGANCATKTGSFTIPAGGIGKRTNLVPVTAIVDSVPDAGETIILTLDDGAAYNIIDGSKVRTYVISVSPPTGLRAIPGNGQVTLRWNNPGNPEITKYRAEWSVGGGPGRRTSPTAAPPPPATR